MRNVVVGLLSLCSVSSAQGINALTVASLPPVKAKVGTTVEAKLPLQVLSGYHVQSNTPSDPYLIALKLTWNPGPNWTGSRTTFGKPCDGWIGKWNA